MTDEWGALDWWELNSDLRIQILNDTTVPGTRYALLALDCTSGSHEV
jgi:hypothetical protein